MKKSIFIILLALMSLSLTACFRLNSFKLKEESITMEYGEELDLSDLSKYVKARDYDKVTVDDSELKQLETRGFKDKLIENGSASTIISFSYPKEGTLDMEVIWKDTTPPGLSTKDFNVYRIQYSMGWLGRPTRAFDNEPHADLIYYDLFDALDDNYMNYDNDNIRGLDEVQYRFSYSSFAESVWGEYKNPFNEFYDVPAGDYTGTITICDPCGNKADHEITVHVLDEVHPKNADRVSREKLEEAIKQLENEPFYIGNNWGIYELEN